MATIVKPNEIKPKRTISALIYGQPSIGKTTLGCSVKNAVLFDYDNGVNRIHPAHAINTLQVESWEDTNNAMDALANDPAFKGVNTIIVDTFGKMLSYMEEYIMRVYPKFRRGNGQLAVQGYGERKRMFQTFMQQLETRGYNVIYIAHEKEEADGDNIVKRPLVSGSAGAELLMELDLVGYVSSRNNRRHIAFQLNDGYLTKNSAHLPDMDIPEVVSPDGMTASENTFMEDVIFAKVREQRQQAADMRNAYNALMADAKAAIEGANSIDALNKVLADIRQREMVKDSRAQIGAAMNARAAQLGGKLEGGKYVQA